MDSKAKSLAKYRHINLAKDTLNDINQASICKMPAPDLETNVSNAELFKTRIRKYISRKEQFRLIEDTLLPKNQVVSYEQLRNCMVDLMKSVSEPIKPK